MFRVSLDGFKQVAGKLRTAAKHLFDAADREVWKTAQEIHNEMRQEGKPITYPVKWDSEKQRRAFFATDGFGRGIPTKRTGQTVGGWKAIRVENGAEVSNPLAHAVYVSGRPNAPAGRRQSRIHRGRWKVFYDVANAAISKLPAKVRERITATFTEQGFEVK